MSKWLRIKLCGPFYVHRRVAVLLVAVSAALLMAILWTKTSVKSPLHEVVAYTQDTRLEESFDSSNMSILWKEYKLKPLKSRGATIFIDEKENIRIPPDFILDMMEMRDLEELYHRCKTMPTPTEDGHRFAVSHRYTQFTYANSENLFNQLSQLYKEYLGTIQALCRQKLHLGQIVDGGYDICQDREVAPRAPCLMYSFGVRDDFSFDEEMSKMYGCEVHSFDPANGMQDHKHSDNIYFHSMGVGDFDGVMQDNWKIRKFSSIKQELGHTDRSLAVLKINMQGGEWSALRDMLNTSALSAVKQLIVRFHTFAEFGHYGFPDLKDVRGHLKIARDLYEDGWRMIFHSRFHHGNCQYTGEGGYKWTGCMDVTFMKRRIEIVKIDIESGEWPVFASMAKDGIFSDVRQLITELHTWVDLPPSWAVYHRKSREYRQHLTVLRQIYDAGLRIFFLRRFDAACCRFKTDLGFERTGCNEVHFMRVNELTV